MSWLALTLALVAALSLPLLTPAQIQSDDPNQSGYPYPPTSSDSNRLYSITGTWALTNDTQISSKINSQPLLPYNGTFWFGLPKSHWCAAPQAGRGNNFTCTAPSYYQPLYTLDRVLALATTHANPSITLTPPGVLTYASTSASAHWSITNEPDDPTPLLAYEVDVTFFACPELLDGGATTAYRVSFDTFDAAVRGGCAQVSLRMDERDADGAVGGTGVKKGLPYDYV